MKHYEPDGRPESRIGALTRVLMRICRRNHVADLQPNFCWGFKVFPPNAFFPIARDAWRFYFDTTPAIVYKTLDIVKNSIAVHLWNEYLTQELVDRFKAKTAYGILAERNCPNVFKTSNYYQIIIKFNDDMNRLLWIMA